MEQQIIRIQNSVHTDEPRESDNGLGANKEEEKKEKRWHITTHNENQYTKLKKLGANQANSIIPFATKDGRSSM